MRVVPSAAGRRECRSQVDASVSRDKRETLEGDDTQSYGEGRRRLSHSQDEAGACARSVRTLPPRPTRASARTLRDARSSREGGASISEIRRSSSVLRMLAFLPPRRRTPNHLPGTCACGAGSARLDPGTSTTAERSRSGASWRPTPPATLSTAATSSRRSTPGDGACAGRLPLLRIPVILHAARVDGIRLFLSLWGNAPRGC
jgi:hypothetical protein